ncbi:energy transducer TonB [Methylicorpusculum sp.]|uniref:energy transducer TonB n=1 Tax=Methylicorpusculum sp. TaxID=2713644 RepID=UPI00271CE124|nr:energy transducer TonB [Methylicorpusculum sp.]MDO8844062.1 energy transducer TonB [Methylicorpusculum sp.]MDP2178892.1 energy transducer TonB [Methylicorpusculum sp.]MDP3530277.1 energy transducer TonB [Methylicorpusculum sp.]MDZ4151272.1 energy transducer TonB [Methylicorpusculum sp.]
MYLFNNHEGGLNKQANRLPVAAIAISGKLRTFFGMLTGEENPRSIAGLLLILVLSLHLWGALRLLQPAEPITQAKPLMMEVSLVSAPGQQATTAPSAPPKAHEPKKPPAKRPVKKDKPVKRAKLPKPVIASDAMLPAPSLTESFADASETSSDAAKSASGTQVNPESYSEASFNANYGTNPKPKYPDIARRRNWQGKVLLRVRVTADGLSEAVSVHRSSGHDALDESAIAAVKNWRFIPAKRGNTAVASTVIVPIIFTLNKH